MSRDSLLRATLTDRTPIEGPDPWRLSSLYFLAFFGGGMAAAAISYLNAGRLGMARETRRGIVALGFAYLLVFSLTLGFVFDHYKSFEDPIAGEQFLATIRSYRLFVPLSSIGLAWILTRIQTRFDRMHQLQRGAVLHYASLWRPGALAALAALPLQILLPALAAWLLWMQHA